MALISPGVEVSVVDESFYVPGVPGAVPLVVVASAQDKTSGTGSGTASGTLSTNANEIFLISSQRELTQTFGDPTFYTDASGTPIQGYELNEYGLQAAYSFLGIANRAFVIRANVNTTELTGSADAPGGRPDDGFYWLDLASSSFGIKEWNASTQSFTAKTPIFITSTDDVTGSPAAPIAAKGSIGDYAIVATNPFNRLFYKTRSNTWVRVGSGDSATKDGSWATAFPTVRGTITNPTLADGQVVINGNVVESGQSLSEFATNINSAAVGVSAAVVDGLLELYATPFATGDDSSTTAQSSSIILSSVGDSTINALDQVGITAGRYYNPRLFIGQHTEDHGFRTSDSKPRPSGSLFLQTTAPSGGASISLKKYSETAGVFETVNAPVFKTQEQALQQLDKALGGSGLTVNDVFVQVNTGESEWDDSTLTTGELIDYVVFRRAAGIGSVTEIVSNKISDKTDTGMSSGDVVKMAETVTNTSTTNTASNFLNQADIHINGTDADDFVSAISAANFEHVEAEYDAVSKRIKLRHNKGGNIYFSDTNGAAMNDLGFGTAKANTYGDNTSLSAEKIANLYIAPAGDKDDYSTLNQGDGSSLDETERTFAFVASNWIPVQNTPDSGTTYTPIQSVSEPTKDPANEQLWYNTTVDEVDILIHNGSTWTGYQNVSSDARGFNLSNTDPKGPIISATEPTTQTDGTALVDGDIWLNTSDLENYPKLYRYDSSQDDGQEFVLIDNTDQTGQDGILFADFRFHTDGTRIFNN